MKAYLFLNGTRLFVTFCIALTFQQLGLASALAESSDIRRATPPEPYTFSRGEPSPDEEFERKKYGKSVTGGLATLFNQVDRNASEVVRITLSVGNSTQSGEFEWKGITLFDPADKLANAVACFVTSKDVSEQTGLTTEAFSKDVPGEDYSLCVIKTQGVTRK